MGPLFLGTVKALLLAQALQGSVVGRVWDAETGQPIPGAIVALADSSRAVRANDNGEYVLRAAPGPNQILVHFVGYSPQSFRALVPGQGQVEVDVSLTPMPVRMPVLDVLAPRDVRDGYGSVFPDREILAGAMWTHPLLAEPDAFQVLDGGDVSLRPETPGGMNVQGGATDQTAYLLDGIPILNPYHAAGLGSAWNPDALSRLRLESTAPPVHVLSAAVEGSTRAPGDRLHGQGGVSTSQSRVTVDGPLRGAGFLVSYRSGFPDAIAPRGESSYIRGETGDWLAKIDAPGLGGSFQLLGYGNTNELSTAASVAPDGGVLPDPRRNTFEWTSRSQGARWSRVLSGTVVRALAWRADAGAGSFWIARTGPAHMGADRHDLGALLGARHETSRTVTSAEIRFENIATSYRILPDSSSTAWDLEATAPVLTALASGERAWGRFRAGLGSSLASIRGKRFVAPHARVTWKASNPLRVSLTGAQTHQFAQSLRNAESIVGNVFPADLYIAAGAAPIARSRSAVLAVDYRAGAGLRLVAQGYARRSRGLLLVAPREGEPFAMTPDAFVTGSGLSRGASAEVVCNAGRFTGILSYGYEHARLGYRDSSYVPESAATHRIAAGVTARPGAGASIRLGLLSVLGRRATRIADGFEWEAANLLDLGSEFGGSPHYGAEPLGGATLPGYARLDLTLEKSWRVTRGGTITTFLAATNLLGRKNLLTYAKDPTSGDLAGVEMRPRAPLVAGMSWGF